MTAPHDQPDAATLLEAVREFLATEVEPQTEGRLRYHGRTFEQAERDLQRDYARNRGDSELDWRRNRHAVRAAWERVDER